MSTFIFGRQIERDEKKSEQRKQKLIQSENAFDIYTAPNPSEMRTDDGIVSKNAHFNFYVIGYLYTTHLYIFYFKMLSTRLPVAGAHLKMNRDNNNASALLAAISTNVHLTRFLWVKFFENSSARYPIH